MIKVCVVCGVEFDAKGNTKTCGDVCKVERRKSPERKAYEKAYKQSPKYKAYMKAYKKAYSQSPEFKESQRNYYQKPDVKAKRKAYEKARVKSYKNIEATATIDNIIELIKA